MICLILFRDTHIKLCSFTLLIFSEHKAIHTTTEYAIIYIENHVGIGNMVAICVTPEVVGYIDWVTGLKLKCIGWQWTRYKDY